MSKKKYGQNLLDDMKIDKTKAHVHKFIDYESYFYDLDFDNQVWLSTFTDEYYNGWFGRNDFRLPDGIMATDEIVKNEYEKIRKDPQVYEQFQEELAEFNRDRRSNYPKYIENTFKRYMEIYYECKERGNTKEIKRKIKLYNNYTQHKYKFPFDKDGYREPVGLPTVYRTLGPLDYIKSKIVNFYNTNQAELKKDLVNYDYSNQNNIVNSKGFQKRLNEDEMDLSDMLSNLTTHVDYDNNEELPYNEVLANEFQNYMKAGKLDIFVLKLFNQAYLEFTCNYKKFSFTEKLIDTYSKLVVMYEKGRLSKLDFFHHVDIINLSMLTFLQENKEELPEVRYIHNIFVKLVFVYHKKRGFKKGKNGKQYVPFSTKLNIPKEFLNE